MSLVVGGRMGRLHKPLLLRAVGPEWCAAKGCTVPTTPPRSVAMRPRPVRHEYQPSLEPLECRVVPAFATYDIGVLYVGGDQTLADAIVVGVSGGVITVTANGIAVPISGEVATTTYLSYILVAGYGGNDRITIDPAIDIT